MHKKLSYLTENVRKGAEQFWGWLISSAPFLQKRFCAVEQALAEQGKMPEQSDLAEMDALWQKMKRLC
ncbi:hypothetical protein [Rheinheimera nanhaiensis]|uniref:Uncharacterized protein n=1 Tax=Rheinheimera nanhaiensis E407-8 TaxID=562729 RepID=I1E1B5_9GAMM|nr:hypothetical protein [Rheinheimera nanhaiensis]GAB60093.1 hypothetical protein RNAN_3107 [Rheinheimera nanhaiensis E407-8]